MLSAQLGYFVILCFVSDFILFIYFFGCCLLHKQQKQSSIAGSLMEVVQNLAYFKFTYFLPKGKCL